VEVWQTSNLRRLRLGEEKKKGKEEEEERKNKPQHENIMVCPILHRATIIKKGDNHLAVHRPAMYC